MMWLTATLLSLLAATALGAPLTSTGAQLAVPAHLLDQGDGAYVATFDDNGKVDVIFTPMVVLLAQDAELPRDNLATEPLKVPDEDIYCAGYSQNEHDLDLVNEKVLKRINGTEFQARSWAWIHYNKETSYVCPYQPWVGSYAVALAAHTTITRACNSKAKYGWVRFRGTEKSSSDAPPDFSIGRTWRGNHFCAEGHAPPENPYDGNRESLDLRDGLHDQGKVTLAIPDHLRDQGDGFYSATFDNSGKMNVAFTPKAELVARDAEALQKRSIKVWCEEGKSKNTDDMNWAIQKLANNAQGVHWTPKHWGWVHKGHETAFFCPYIAWNGLLTDVTELNKRIDETCGSRADYGFFRHEPRVGDRGLPNFSVGRTWRGDSFCEQGHAPGSIQQADLDQGDGFYAAVLDEDTGKVNITFTPKDELVARNAVSDNPAAKSIRALQKRDGVECVDGVSKNKADLDYATRKVAEGVEGMRYDPTVWTWFHNNKETVYVCCYRAWHGSSKTVWDYISYINDGCQSEVDYGYNHHAARNEADINLSVGRTWRGNKFCDRYHHPNPPSGTWSAQYGYGPFPPKSNSEGDPPTGVSRPPA